MQGRNQWTREEASSIMDVSDESGVGGGNEELSEEEEVGH